jgi:TDG/mug DNA glycosylase family protein
VTRASQGRSVRTRPSSADLAAAAGTTIPDVIAPDLAVLFCGINPGLWSAATGHHFARPGNRFWPALYRSGFTPRLLRPDEQAELLGYGLGITNVAARASAGAAELSTVELVDGGRKLATKVRRYQPARVCVLGIGAYRTAFGRPAATLGPQPDLLAGVPVWVLPNPSGLNASWPTPRLVEAFAELRREAEFSGTSLA